MSDSRLKALTSAVDVAVWGWNVKKNTKPGYKCMVDWKSCLDDLSEAWHMYLLTDPDKVLVLSEEQPPKDAADES